MAPNQDVRQTIVQLLSNMKERLKTLENLAGIATSSDEFEELRREIEKEFAQGGGI